VPRFELLARVVEEREREVDQAAGDRLPVDQHVLLGEVPPARAHQERGDLLVQAVLLPFGRGERKRAADGVLQVLCPTTMLLQVGERASSSPP